MKLCGIMFSVMILTFVVVTSGAQLRIIDAMKGTEYGQMFGDRCEGLGDVNGDGYADFLVAEWKNHKLHLYLGGPHPFDSPPALTWENHGSTSNYFSFPPKNIGDVDCDGVSDFVSLFNGNDSLRLYYGMESLEPNQYLTLLADTITSWTFVTCGDGDNNKDGRPEFWMYKYHGLLNDTIWGYSGCDLLDEVPDFRVVQSRQPDNKYQFGTEMCNTCDLNGDSIPDIVYGQYTSYSAYPGRVCIIWGGETLSSEPDLVFYAPYPHGGNSAFGVDLACLGDISGDGIDDIWIGQGGRNYIYFGGKPFDTIPDIGLDWSYISTGDYIEAIGDINDDGYTDVMLSMDSYLINYISFIYCYPGMDTLMDAVWSDADYAGAVANGSMCCIGTGHSWVGDVDGDGIDDILLAPKESDVEMYDLGWSVIQAGWHEPVAVDNDQRVEAVPDHIQLRQNYPNPFNSGTVIEFTLPRGGYTEVKVLNLLGEVVAAIFQGRLDAGVHQVRWDGKDDEGHSTATGTYFYQVKSGEYHETRKMVLLK